MLMFLTMLVYRYQSQSMPLVSRAEIDTAKYRCKQTLYMPSVESIPECPVEYLPSKDWERDVLSKFSELRNLIDMLKVKELERGIPVPPLRNKNAWLAFCFGETSSSDEDDAVSIGDTVPDETTAEECGEQDIKRRKIACAKLIGLDLASSVIDAGDVCDEESEEENVPTYLINVPPSMSLLLQFDQVLTQKILGYLVGHFRNSTFNPTSHGTWMYSLLARLEKPLHQDTAALVRDLYRLCCQHRDKLSKLDTGNSDEALAAVNTLVVICGSYFGQGEDFVSSVSFSEDDADEGFVSGEDDYADDDIEEEEYFEYDDDQYQPNSTGAEDEMPETVSRGNTVTFSAPLVSEYSSRTVAQSLNGVCDEIEEGEIL
jgi:hypothetical protein